MLVTDYSSAMFDFAVTGRPMLFFTYDLADYRDSLRGFYFDFEAEAPGPLLATSDEVIAAVRDAGAVAASYQDAYEIFMARFAPWTTARPAPGSATASSPIWSARPPPGTTPPCRRRNPSARARCC